MRSTILAVAIASAFALPTPVHVRFRMHRSDPADEARAEQALSRGLYRDSLIVVVPRVDPLRPHPTGRTAVIDVGFAERGDEVRVCLIVFDVLARTVAGPDTAVVAKGAVDSVLTEYGAHYARILSEQRWPARQTSHRCA